MERKRTGLHRVEVGARKSFASKSFGEREDVDSVLLVDASSDALPSPSTLSSHYFNANDFQPPTSTRYNLNSTIQSGISKHPLWTVDAIYDEKPFQRNDNINIHLYDQFDGRNTCGVYCVLNLFGSIKSLKINNSTIINSLSNLSKQLHHAHLVSAKTGNLHRGFFSSLFRNSKNEISVKNLKIKFESKKGHMTWREIIESTLKIDIHIIIVIGQFESLDNEMYHCIGVDLIHGLVYDSAESNGVCFVLDVNRLQHKILAYPKYVVGFTFKGDAFVEFNLIHSVFK